MIHILKWSFQEEFIETALGAVLRTPGLILCDYWHQKCLDYSVPKSFELTELSDSSLHLSVLFLVRKCQYFKPNDIVIQGRRNGGGPGGHVPAHILEI